MPFTALRFDCRARLLRRVVPRGAALLLCAGLSVACLRAQTTGPGTRPPGARPPAAPARPAPDYVRGEEYLFKMSAALVGAKASFASVAVLERITLYGPEQPNGRLQLRQSSVFTFPSRLIQVTEAFGQKSYLELSDTLQRSTASGLVSEAPPGPAHDALARHYLNLALSCRRLKPSYLGLEALPVEPAPPGGPVTTPRPAPNLKHIRVQVMPAGYRAEAAALGPIELLLHPTTFLPVRIRYRAVVSPGAPPVQVEERLSDWRSVGGVRMAYRWQQLHEAQLAAEGTLDTHRVNK